ncbi:MAG: FAD:protein FMN transferase, partial [Acidobacteria bacterium]|nr:FAD:protein FMN transferase [Acidobacteriota bacterium]
VQTAFAGAAMGTTWNVKILAPGELGDREQQAGAAIRDALEDVNSKMSTYVADSELSRFNAHRSSDPFPVSAETMAVFVEAKRIGELTGGAFDITVGPLVNAWGFGPADRREDLDQAALDELRSHTGWDKLLIHEGEGTLVKLDPELYCDLSAIAKGYAVDRVSAALTAIGFPDHMVEVGGEVYANGHNGEGRPWRIGIEKPDSVAGMQRVVGLDGLAMATSGDYRNYFERDGKRFSHEIDPATGRPVEHRTASVSVLEPTCAAADALATGLIVMGEERGYQRAVELEIAAQFLIREGDGFVEKTTPAFDRFAGPLQ